MKGIRMLTAGLLIALSLLPLGLGLLQLYANICRPEESPEWTAHMIRQGAVLTLLGLAGVTLGFFWALKSLKCRNERNVNKDGSANNNLNPIENGAPFSKG